MVTQQEASDMRDAIKQLEANEETQRLTKIAARVVVAQSWWDGIKPAVPTTRAEALAVFQFIEAEIVTQINLRDGETDDAQKLIFRDRINILRKKLGEADEKFKERKLNA